MKRTRREFLSILRERQRGRESGRELVRVQLEKLSVASSQVLELCPPAGSICGRLPMTTESSDASSAVSCWATKVRSTFTVRDFDNIRHSNEARLTELALCPGNTPCSLLPLPSPCTADRQARLSLPCDNYGNCWGRPHCVWAGARAGARAREGNALNIINKL